jgi:hypothetical protein
MVAKGQKRTNHRGENPLLSVVTPIADKRGRGWIVRLVPQKRSDHTRFGLHVMSWVPSVRFQPLGSRPAGAAPARVDRQQVH